MYQSAKGAQQDTLCDAQRARCDYDARDARQARATTPSTRQRDATRRFRFSSRRFSTFRSAADYCLLLYCSPLFSSLFAFAFHFDR
jgi:hypothetical protein